MLPAASAGPSFQAAIVQREVPRHDQPDDAERLADGERLAAGDGDRVAEQPLGRAGVVAERVDHHPHLAARGADRLAGVARLEQRELLEVRLERVGERAQDAPPARRGASARQRGQRLPRAGDGLVDLGRARAGNLGEHRLGGGLDDCQRVRQPPARRRAQRRRRRDRRSSGPAP